MKCSIIETDTGFIFDFVKHSGFKQDFLLTSDEHIDNKHHLSKFWKRAHDEAKERNAIILKFGDVADVMGAKFDKRNFMGDVDQEFNKANYFNVVADGIAKRLMPYKDNILFFGNGNHEESVTKHHHIDILDMVNDKLGSVAKRGGYEGFIRLRFKTSSGSDSQRIDIYYNHGNGGGQRTHGLSTHLDYQAFNIADIYVSGHNHKSFQFPSYVTSLNDRGNVERRRTAHIKIGTSEGKGNIKYSRQFESKFPYPSISFAWLTVFSNNGREVNFEHAPCLPYNSELE